MTHSRQQSSLQDFRPEPQSGPLISKITENLQMVPQYYMCNEWITVSHDEFLFVWAKKRHALPVIKRLIALRGSCKKQHAFINDWNLLKVVLSK